MTDDAPPTAATDEQDDDATDRAVLDALADRTVPLATTDPEADLGDVEPLGDALAEPRIVALGEATHGTREFFQLKHRLLRYLVTELGVRTFGLEANFSEALALDEYVVHGRGDPRDALDGVYFWTLNVESVLTMVEWLRSFNADRPLDDRVRFYGFDAQYAQGAVEELRDYFESVDSDFLSTVRDDLEAVADDGTPPHQDDDLERRIEVTDEVVPELQERLAANREAYVADSSESAWELADQHVATIERATEYKRAMRAMQAAESESEETAALERLIRVRDRAMADAVEWILEYEDAEQIALWGHDAHVNREKHASRDTDAEAVSLGSHLADRYGEDYFALGFAFGRGSFQAVSEDPDAADDEESYALREQTVDGPLADTVEATLAELDSPLAVVNLRAAGADDEVARWLDAPRRHFSVGATYDPENPTEYVTEYAYDDAFDAVCYVEETTRARPVERD